MIKEGLEDCHDFIKCLVT